MKKSNFYLLMYDITNNRTILKVSKKLVNHGFIRINYSVWIGFINPLGNGSLKNELQIFLRAEEAKGSRLFVIPLTSQTLGKLRNISGRKPSELDFWLGKVNNVFY